MGKNYKDILEFKGYCQAMEARMNAASAQIRKEFEDFQETEKAKSDFFSKLKGVGKKSPPESTSPKPPAAKKDKADKEAERRSNAGSGVESPVSRKRTNISKPKEKSNAAKEPSNKAMEIPTS